jgi:hypothetical protein
VQSPRSPFRQTCVCVHPIVTGRVNEPESSFDWSRPLMVQGCHAVMVIHAASGVGRDYDVLGLLRCGVKDGDRRHGYFVNLKFWGSASPAFFASSTLTQDWLPTELTPPMTTAPPLTWKHEFPLNDVADFNA